MLYRQSGTVLAAGVLFFAAVPFVVVVDGGSYSCAEQYIMAERARTFEEVELVMSSPDPSTHKRIGRGVRNFDSAVRDEEKTNTVLSGN